MNTLRVGLLLVALTTLFVLVGAWLGGTTGMFLAFILALVLNFGTYWFSDRVVLRMTRAHPLTREEVPELYRMVERLSSQAGIPVPRLYLVPDPQPNAFATGRNPEHGVVAVNEGLVRLLTAEEIEGVLAHEIAHIKHRDTLTMAVVASLAGAISTLINMAQWAMIFGGSDDEEGVNPLTLLVAAIFAPLAAMLIQLSVSRAREFEADRTAASLAGSPDGLIHALLKLHRGVERIPSAVAQPSTAHLAIVNPLAAGGRGVLSGFSRLFLTHPPVEARISALQKSHRKEVMA